MGDGKVAAQIGLLRVLIGESRIEMSVFGVAVELLGKGGKLLWMH